MKTWLLFFFGSLGLTVLLLPLACTTTPECRSDRDCTSKRGESYLCVQQACKLRSSVEFPPDAEPGPPLELPEAEPFPEPKLEPRPEPPPELRPEPSPEPLPESTEGKKQLHQPCLWYPDAPLAERCARGLICIRQNADTALCFEDCSDNPSKCINNPDRKDCRTIRSTATSQPISICVSLAKEGERCNLDESIYCLSSTGAHLSCKLGKCEAAQLLSQVGADCSATLVPPAECDASVGLACNPFTNRCVQGAEVFTGDICDSNGPRICSRGSRCVSLAGTSRPTLCLRDCDTKNPLTTCSIEGSGFACQPITGGACTTDAQCAVSLKCVNGTCSGGACIQSCKAQQDCRYQSYPLECAGPNAQSLTCIPMPPSTGTATFGQRCRPPANPCKHPFTCIVPGANADGFCGIQCRTDPDCTLYNPTARCSLINNTNQLRFCGWSCSGGAGCPTDFACAASNLCFPK